MDRQLGMFLSSIDGCKNPDPFSLFV
jgi:hypothetical protein